ncbi:Ppx/GppA phosphatase family protein [Rhabdothermincola salaria]|uniref:Ppx/GppA phosphatase family protein n=1 Tax=Rhabdothermincola salaria TaxID=2903142 RepID=UPI001E4B0FB9|nr:Ppx/GppA family phosphatase [Rhabdothermincola salaria]
MSDDATPVERPLAAIDIGTNSFHMVVARIGRGPGDGGGEFEVIAREKEMVRLGSASGDMKRLVPDAIDRGVQALARMARIAAIHDADVHAVATSAVREAENAEEFLSRARDEAGVEVEVISGVEEARLIHLGVLQAVPVFDRRLVLVDIGGGSTEILVGERGETLAVGSLKLGAIRLTRRFFRGDRLHPGAVDACRRNIRSVLAPMARDVERVGFEVAVVSSGTAEAVVAMALTARGDEPARTYNNASVTAAEIAAVVDELIAAETVEGRRRLPGMDAGRADIILAGALILDGVVRGLGIDEVVFSDYALREGALLDALARRRGANLHHLRDLRRRSVVALAASMDDEPEHSERTAGLALELFDATARWHGLDDEWRELLEAGALLANVGQAISHSEHHKHSYYLIRHSDRLAGFTDHEIELIALIARYHRKSAPKPKHTEFARLRPEDQEAVTVLAGILRVAIALDRSHAGPVEHLRVTSANGSGPLQILVTGRPGADLSLELHTGTERKDLLERVLGHRIDLVAT